MSENYGKNPVCIECGDSISNPICHECMQEEIIAWLVDTAYRKGMNVDKLKAAVAMKAKELWGYPETGITCVTCGEGLLICSYCFIRHVESVFNREKVAIPFPSFSFSSSHHFDFEKYFGPEIIP